MKFLKSIHLQRQKFVYGKTQNCLLIKLINPVFKDKVVFHLLLRGITYT